jgi:hypothetical protein
MQALITQARKPIPTGDANLVRKYIARCLCERNRPRCRRAGVMEFSGGLKKYRLNPLTL